MCYAFLGCDRKVLSIEQRCLNTQRMFCNQKGMRTSPEKEAGSAMLPNLIRVGTPNTNWQAQLASSAILEGVDEPPNSRMGKRPLARCYPSAEAVRSILLFNVGVVFVLPVEHMSRRYPSAATLPSATYLAHQADCSVYRRLPHSFPVREPPSVLGSPYFRACFNMATGSLHGATRLRQGSMFSRHA